MNREQADIKFKEAQTTINKRLKHILDYLSEIDVESLMSSLRDQMSQTRKVVHYDSHLIHVKVDRRKNINLIRDQIQSEVEDIIGCDNTKTLFKIHVANNMIIIKRRR